MTKEKDDIKELLDAMVEFRGKVETMRDNSRDYGLKWLSAAIENLLNVVDIHVNELKEALK